MAKQSICLNMIVKDEAHIIEQTIKNICDHVPLSYWVICDTGSTDGTQEKIKAAFERLGIPGTLHQHTWRNFGHNRNEALKLCKGKGDFVLFFDADDKIEGTPDFSSLIGDAFNVKMRSDVERPSYYSRKLLIRNDGRARWRGVVHEYIDTGDMIDATLGGDYVVVSRRLGARSNDPEKYLKDARLLEVAFEDPADADIRPRYAFYCANSWRDYGDMAKALIWYEKRFSLKGWQEERFLSCLEAGLICERNGDIEKAINWWFSGHEIVPDRAECLYHISRVLRQQGKFHCALIIAKEASKITVPGGKRLFLKSSIYDFWTAYEVLFLTGRTGGDPRSASCFDSFMNSAAPDSAKASVRKFVPTHAE